MWGILHSVGKSGVRVKAGAATWVRTQTFTYALIRRFCTMTLKPLGDRVLVKPAPKEEKTSTGLYIASAAQEKPQRGEVLAVGAGKYDQDGKRIALDVHVGDQVFYGKFGGTEVKVDGEELLLLRADDIYAIVED